MKGSGKTSRAKPYCLGSNFWASLKESVYNAGDLGLIPWSGYPLEKGMVTHSNPAAWRILWTEEPGGLLSMGSKKSWTRLSNYTFKAVNWASLGGSGGKESACNAGD